MFHIFSFFNINKTQEHTMNLSDLLLVELYNENVKIFNHAWEETLLAQVSDLDEHFLENLYERQANTFTLMKNAMTLCRQDILAKKNQEATTDLRSMVNDILEQQQQKMLISQNERARDGAAAAYSSKRSEERRKYLRSWDIKKARAEKAENALSNLTLQRMALPALQPLGTGNKWRTPCWICSSQFQKDLKCQMHLLQLRKLDVTPPSIKVVEEQHISEKLPTVVTNVGGDTMAKDTNSQPRANHFFFIHRPKNPKCGFCEKTKQLVQGPPPVGTRNPRVLGSSQPTPEELLRKGGAQGGSGSSGSPSWVQGELVQSDTGQHYILVELDTYVSNAVSSSSSTWSSPWGAAMSAPSRDSEHSSATPCFCYTVILGSLVV